MSEDDGITITEEGVTFSPPPAMARIAALDPRGPSDPVEAPPAVVDAAPLYVVVMHDGVEVLYKKVGD